MKLEAKATVLSVGGSTVGFALDGGAEVFLPATVDEQRAFGALLYQDVTITVTAAPVSEAAKR